MNIQLRKSAHEIISILNSLPCVKHCELYGSIANGTEDVYSDIDISADVSGCDNGVFMLELPELLSQKANILYHDFAPSLIPEAYIVTFAVNGENPFSTIVVKCIASPHCKTVTRDMAVNDIFTHTLKLWTANYKHYIRSAECRSDILRMARRLAIPDVDLKESGELLQETLLWLKNNSAEKYFGYINFCKQYINGK